MAHIPFAALTAMRFFTRRRLALKSVAQTVPDSSTGDYLLERERAGVAARSSSQVNTTASPPTRAQAAS